MVYSFLISEAAFNDINEAGKWYERHKDGLSIDFEICLNGGFEDIKINPLAVQIKYQNVRVKYIRKFPYGIHFIIDKKIIYILAVFHTSKNPNKWTKRLK